jgi:hypothetical protein
MRRRNGFWRGEETMARYDEWRGEARESARGRGAGWRSGYDTGFDRQPRGWGVESGGRQFEEGRSGGGVYGPARYGLGPYYQRLLDRRRPDDELQEEVEEALFYDSWVDAEAITVEVADGVVTLRGDLPSYEEIRYAIDDAWDVDGVRGVRSELNVR